MTRFDAVNSFPNSPLANFAYCPDPARMTDAEIEREIPRAAWLSELSSLASLTQPYPEPTPQHRPISEMHAQ